LLFQTGLAIYGRARKGLFIVKHVCFVIIILASTGTKIAIKDALVIAGIDGRVRVGHKMVSEVGERRAHLFTWDRKEGDSLS
jgi:hypothetical protein